MEMDLSAQFWSLKIHMISSYLDNLSSKGIIPFITWLVLQSNGHPFKSFLQKQLQYMPKYLQQSSHQLQNRHLFNMAHLFLSLSAFLLDIMWFTLYSLTGLIRLTIINMNKCFTFLLVMEWYVLLSTQFILCLGSNFLP
jgi:hypothetical protein